MKWFKAESVTELKACGSFSEVRQEIQSSIGKQFQLKARSWRDLLKAIKDLHRVLENEDQQEVIIPNGSLTYFKCKADKIIFALLELEGEPRLKMLSANKSHYRDLEKARKWRNELAKIIHPDKCKHPKATLATNELNKLFNNMTNK